MSAMTAEDVREATLDLSDTTVYFCEEHQVWVKTGKDCLFCEYDLYGDTIFE